MKKILLATLLSSSIAFAGCATKEQPKETKQEQVAESKATIELEQGSETTSKEVTFTEGQVLMDVLKDNYKVEEKDGFINAIDNLSANAENKEFIAIYVNGEMAQVGASDLALKNGDTVTFKIETW